MNGWLIFFSLFFLSLEIGSVTLCYCVFNSPLHYKSTRLFSRLLCIVELLSCFFRLRISFFELPFWNSIQFCGYLFAIGMYSNFGFRFIFILLFDYILICATEIFQKLNFAFRQKFCVFFFAFRLLSFQLNLESITEHMIYAKWSTIDTNQNLHFFLFSAKIDEVDIRHNVEYFDENFVFVCTALALNNI